MIRQDYIKLNVIAHIEYKCVWMNQKCQFASAIFSAVFTFTTQKYASTNKNIFKIETKH